ncbi:hypothetical protein ATCC90586_006779 [Pythium insidiosum]|nr:hypothetical protein ATCC90586_006779 [Pythium insidiosum]
MAGVRLCRDLSDELIVSPSTDDGASALERTAVSVSPPDDEIAVMEAQFFRVAATSKHQYIVPLGSGSDHDAAASCHSVRRVAPVAARRVELLTADVPSRRVLTTLGLVCLCYFKVCGGPVGSELTVSTAGPLFGLLGLVVFPILFNIPITVVIAELCSAFPEDGGFAMWILNAFGPFWGFLAGYWAWVGSVFDRILYVQILFSYLCDALGVEMRSGVLRYIVKAAVALLLTLPSLYGTRGLSAVLFVSLLCVLATFSVFSGWALTETSGLQQYTEIRRANISFPDSSGSQDGHAASLSGPWDIHWALYVNTLFWNFDGFYLASVFGGEVSNPARTYPRAFKISFVLLWLTYVVSLTAAVGSNRPHWTTWQENAFPDLGEAVGGPALHVVVLVGSLVAVAGLFMTEVFCEAFQMCGMADCGLLPSAFQRRDSHYGAPQAAITFSLGCVLLGLAFDANEVLVMKNAFAAAVELLILVAALQLRRTLPLVPRPSRVPGGLGTLGLVLVLPAALLVYLIANVFSRPRAALLFVVVTALGSVCALLRRLRVAQRQRHRVR